MSESSFGVILAGGIGSRFGSSIPKQYMKLNGREIVSYSIEAFRNSTVKENFVVVVDEAEFNKGTIANKHGVVCIKGGKTRNESIASALNYIKEQKLNVEKIIIHDGARPFIQTEYINKYLELLDTHEAVITAVKIIDSIGYLNNEQVDREKYFLIQAPEAYRYHQFIKYFDKDSVTTTPLQQLPTDINVCKFYDFTFNLKITYPKDLFIAEQYIKAIYRNENFNLKLSKDNIDKKFLILGGSGGVGSEIVKQLKNNGNEFLAPTHKELDLKTLTVESLKSFLKEWTPDVIVNCAASNFSDSDGLVEKFDELFAINLKSNLVLIEYAKTLKHRVNIVLISSSSATKGRENITLYSASKVGVNSIIESLAKSLVAQNIYLNAIVPEKIDTPLIQKLHKCDLNKQEMLSVEEVAESIFGLSFTNEYGKLVHIRKGL